MDIAGIILAGGRATRMGGGDKCLRPLNGRPVLIHVIDRLRPQVATMALSANGPAERFHSFELEILPDTIRAAGPLAGVLAGLEWARKHGFERILTVAADTPFFPNDLCKRLIEAADEARRVVLAASGGRTHPTFALWPVLLADDLKLFLEREGSASMQAFAGLHCPPALVQFPVDGGRDPFFNINRPSDLEEAERIAAEMMQ